MENRKNCHVISTNVGIDREAKTIIVYVPALLKPNVTIYDIYKEAIEIIKKKYPESEVDDLIMGGDFRHLGSEKDVEIIKAD